jgi:mono/diheme cytochrome c family protein
MGIRECLTVGLIGAASLLCVAACGEETGETIAAEDKLTAEEQRVQDVLHLTGRVKEGESVYLRTCGVVGCHGPYGTGVDNNGWAADHTVVISPMYNEAIVAQVLFGGGEMPPQGEPEGFAMSGQQIADVLAYVRYTFR